MPNSQTETIESFAYEGALAWPTAVWLLLGVMAFTSFLLWKERHVTGVGPATLFLALRLAAISLVVWMLLGPTHLKTDRTTFPHTIAVVVDNSDSMGVADELPPIDRLRWSIGASRQASEHQDLKSADQALFALRFALHALAEVGEACNGYTSKEEAEQRIASLQTAIDRTANHLRRAGRSANKRNSDLGSRMEHAAGQLERDTSAPLTQLTVGWQSMVPTDLVELLDDLQESLSRRERQADSYRRELAEGVGGRQDLARQASAQQRLSTRRDLSLKALERLEAGVLEEIEEKVNIRRVIVSDAAEVVPPGVTWAEAMDRQQEKSPAFEADPYQGCTNLTAAIDLLRQDGASESIVAALFLTDGRQNAPGASDPQQVATALTGLPVFAAAFGVQQEQRDILLSHVEAPSSVALNDEIVISAIVSGIGLHGETAQVELRYAGEAIQQRNLEFDSQRQDHNVSFRVKAEAFGRHEYDVVVSPVDDEASPTNNSAVLSVRVLRDKLRVVLADRISRWEFRYLDNLFRRDEHVEFDKLLYLPRLIATGGLEATKELPRDVDGWSAYDVAILGDLAPDTLDAQQQDSLREWIDKRGGNLVVIAGKEAMPHQYRRGPLVELLPVQEMPGMTKSIDGYLPQLSQAGARSKALMLADSLWESAELWQTQYRKSPIYFLSSYCQPKPAARLLISATEREQFVQIEDSNQQDQRALLAWQEVGAGSVVYLASPVSYHLRFRRGDELHHRFWGQMLRWLTAADRGKNAGRVVLSTSASTYHMGDPVDVVVLLSSEDGAPLSGAKINAKAESPTGDPVTVPLTADPNIPGRYLGRFDHLPPGAYRITPVGKQVDALATDGDASRDELASSVVTIVAPENIEMEVTSGNHALLEELAAVTGGQVVPPTAIEEVLRLTAAAPRVVEESVRTPLWNRWSYLWLIVGCLVAEWAVRRRIGLI